MSDRFRGGDQVGWNAHVQEYLAQPAASAAALKAATATVASVVVLTTADLLDPGEAAILANPRKLTFTTAGGTPADAPANVVIVGTDKNDVVNGETLNLAQTGTAVTSVNRYKTITSLTYPAADGTDATIAIGYAASADLGGAPYRLAVCTGAGDFVFQLPDGNSVTRTLAVGDKLSEYAIVGFVSNTGTVELFR